NRSTGPEMRPAKCSATRSRVRSRSSTGYHSGRRAITPTFAVSPLSPDRAWAMSRSRTRVMGETSSAASSHQLHSGLYDALVDERRPVRDDLLDLGASAGKARDAGRPVEDQGRELAREPLDVGPPRPADADA